MYSLKNRAIAGAAALIATVATIGFAAPLRAEPISRTISYADLDLSSAAGQATMARRIRNAVTEVCGPVGPSNRPSVIACRQSARAGAEARLASAQAKGGSVQLASTR